MNKFNDTLLNLEILAEEAAEIIEIKSKIIRFGFDNAYMGDIPNRKKLEREIGHFMAIVDILIDTKIITEQGIKDGKQHKIRKLPRWYWYKKSKKGD